MSVGGLLLNIVSGGATGLVGGLFQSIFGYLGKKQDQKFQLEMIKANAEVAKQEWAQRTELAKVEGETQKEVSANKAFEEGLRGDDVLLSERVKPTKGQGWVLVIVDAIKQIIRPGLTLYLCGLATMMYLEAKAMLAAIGLKDIPIQTAIEVHGKLSDVLLYLFSACVMFWFYQRAPAFKK